MNAQTERFTINGPTGILEVARDLAAGADGVQRGTAIIAHPHPLFAGTMDNKVVQTLARAFVASGWTALRFNFRGVGQSAGSYDEGRGERDDFLAVVEQLAPEGNLALAGFSFGSFVMSHALAELWPKRQIDKAWGPDPDKTLRSSAQVEQAVYRMVFATVSTARRTLIAWTCILCQPFTASHFTRRLCIC